MQEAIRVRPTQDGTYTVYKGTTAIVTGLTRLQAERYGAGVARERPRTPRLPSVA